MSTAPIHSAKVPCKGDYLPQYAHQGDAGADLRSSEARTLAPRSRELVPTGIQIVARHLDDQRVFQVGAALEKTQPWLDCRERRPVINF